MATLCIRTGKTPGYEIQFFDTNGRRQTIYLGGRKYSEKTANELKGVVETLVYYLDNSLTVLDKRTLAWIESASPDIREKLAKAGLIEVPPEHTVRELWDEFLKQKGGIEESTMKTYEASKDRFFAYFKGNEPLNDLTLEKMQQWKNFLLVDFPRTRTKAKGLAEATTAGTILKTKAVFNWGIRSKWIETSPLKGLDPGSFVNEENECEIEVDEYFRLLECCPCQDWRCILALARIGGLRAPSEVMLLRWSDIHWKRGEFISPSPKTKRYQGKGRRIVPLFPMLRTELERLYQMESSRDRVYVINRYLELDSVRDPEETNLGTQFGRIAKKAGVGPFSRPFDNLRASRSNEVDYYHGSKNETAWIGHTVETARKHYLRTMKGDIQRALNLGAHYLDVDWAKYATREEYEKYVAECREKP